MINASKPVVLSVLGAEWDPWGWKRLIWQWSSSLILSQHWFYDLTAPLNNRKLNLICASTNTERVVFFLTVLFASLHPLLTLPPFTVYLQWDRCCSSGYEGEINFVIRSEIPCLYIILPPALLWGSAHEKWMSNQYLTKGHQSGPQPQRQGGKRQIHRHRSIIYSWGTSKTSMFLLLDVRFHLCIFWWWAGLLGQLRHAQTLTPHHPLWGGGQQRPFSLSVQRTRHRLSNLFW